RSNAAVSPTKWGWFRWRRVARVSQHIVHWDDLDSNHGEAGSISSHWTNLSRAAGSVRIRANRISVDPGKRSTPLHAESDEEIFFILRGSGLAWQREDESDADVTYEVRAGDCLVHLVDAEAHTLVAGEDGIDALAFGVGPEWTYAYFPRLSVIRVAHAIVDVDGRHQWPMEAQLPEPELPEPSPRPGRIVNVDERRPCVPRRRRGDDDACLRNPRPQRHLLLPALGQDLFPRCRPDDAGPATRLLGRRARRAGLIV